MRFGFVRALPMASLAAVTATALWASPGAAQLGDPQGPGQAVAAPPSMCSRTISCAYGERNYLPNGYRFQNLQVCGANCTTQYWVRNIPDDKVLLTLPPVRGGGLVAVRGTSDPNDAHPPVRVVVPDYLPTDAACCPSQYQDTTYTWNAATESLTAGAPTIIPAAQFGGWDNMRQQLQNDQFFPVFGS
jgi:hypothetical protein